MKRRMLAMSLVFACVPMANWAETATSSRPLVYFNQNIGFNVKGYNYAQSEFPCEIDKVLAREIIERGVQEGVEIEAVSTADKIQSKEHPVLAIDIESLNLGSKEYSFGEKSNSNLPSVKVTAALMNNGTPEGYSLAKHSCAIATVNELVITSSVLDMGTYGVTVCSATHKCLIDLSKDIVRWVVPQVR